MALCADCQKDYDGWLDYREPYTKWVQYGSVVRSIESYHAKAAERYKLIRQQCDLIKAICQKNH
jgi:hypothetical protein